MKLLTPTAKMMHAPEGWTNLGVQLLPGNKSGIELCPDRGACLATCLESSGHGKQAVVRRARELRSRLWAESKPLFIEALLDELQSLQRRKADGWIAIRLNAFSDIAWEDEAPELFAAFPRVQFYDYTKSTSRARRSRGNTSLWWPGNYDLTYSWSEKASGPFGAMHLRQGGKIAIVHRGGWWEPETLPKWMQSHHLADGDQHDLTFLHQPGSILMLSPKGKLKARRTKFA